MMKDERWLELLSDEARADVLKTKIVQEEETKRKIVSEKEETRRTYVTSPSEGYYLIRIITWIAIVIIAANSTCAIRSKINADAAIKLNDPKLLYDNDCHK